MNDLGYTPATLHVPASGWVYQLTAEDVRAGYALVAIEGGVSPEEAHAVLSTALRRFAVRSADASSRGGSMPWSTFARFVEAYQGGVPAVGTRRAGFYGADRRAGTFDDRAPSDAHRRIVDRVMVGGDDLTAFPAEHWGAPSMYPGLVVADFWRTIGQAVSRRNRDYRFVNVGGTKPVSGRSNIFVSTGRTRAMRADVYLKGAAGTAAGVVLGACAAAALVGVKP